MGCGSCHQIAQESGASLYCQISIHSLSITRAPTLRRMNWWPGGDCHGWRQLRFDGWIC